MATISSPGCCAVVAKELAGKAVCFYVLLKAKKLTRQNTAAANNRLYGEIRR
jgi:hypothetical protein